MGHKYSTVYTHNTHASYQSTHLIDEIGRKIGKNNYLVFDKYPGYNRCKICYEKLNGKSTIMLNCSQLKHRYHTECMNNNIQYNANKEVFKCNLCRELLSNIK